MWLDLAFDPFAILALGGHQTVVELQAEPEAGRARVLIKGACVIMWDQVVIDDFEFMASIRR